MRRFLQLGVIVDGPDVYTGMLAKGRRLGPLVGAQAVLTDGTRAHRVGAAVLTTAATAPLLGPLGMVVGLGKKNKAAALVAFPDGSVHERKLDGNMAIRQAQSEVVQFNALAAAATPAPVPPQAPTQPSPQVQAQLEELQARINELQAQLDRRPPDPEAQ